MKTLAILVVALFASSVFALEIKTTTVYSFVTNSVQADSIGYISFTAKSPNLTIQTSQGNVTLLVPSVTNTTSWAATNVLGATWKSVSSFAGTTQRTYHDVLTVGVPYTLRFTCAATETNTVTLIVK